MWSRPRWRGKVATPRSTGAASGPRVRVRYARPREDDESIRRAARPARATLGSFPRPFPGRAPPAAHRSRSPKVAEVRVVEGPATIKGENGLLQPTPLNVRLTATSPTCRRGPAGRSYRRASPCPEAGSSSGRASSSTRTRPEAGRSPWSCRSCSPDLRPPLLDLPRPGRRRP